MYRSSPRAYPAASTALQRLRYRPEKRRSGLDYLFAAGVTRQTIGLIEAGEFNPSLKLCISICRALGVTLNDLFWEDEDDDENQD
ncbi:helix-turn-helix transcriptional regulator [Slackia heliotrinireducens]|uniref:helix-turn-helix transcriptional regulator n=1 Tax=Slackia heliotrinireducens TaxID=84110 RepID=UPI0003164F15